ncbi:MAG: hypothetical protein ACLT5P_14305 [Flavonifractor plautii]
MRRSWGPVIRHQHYGGTARASAQKPEVPGLAAARHPVQQGGSGSSGCRQGVQSLKSRLLLGVEHRGAARSSPPSPRPNSHGVPGEDTALFQERRVALAAPVK